mgnify:CR=1 FL=1
MFTVWLALHALQAAAAPVELPPGVPPEAWSNALALAGLHAGVVPDRAPGARLGATDGRWWLWVRAQDGTEHVLQVDVPATRADREALASLIASLIRPVSLPDVPLPEVLTPAPTPNPRPTPHHAPRAVEPSPSEPGVAVAPIAWAPATPIRATPPPIRTWPSSPSPPARVAHGFAPWAAVAPTVRLRPTVRPAPGVAAWAGVAGNVGAVPLRVGLGAEGTALAELPQLDADSAFGTLDLRASAAWAPGLWELGPVGSASVRALTDPAGLVVRGPTPTVGLWLARRSPLDEVGWVRASVLVELDLAPTIVLDADGWPFRVSPVAVGLAVGIGAGR